MYLYKRFLMVCLMYQRFKKPLRNMYWERWLRAFMQRAWNLWLCCKCWHFCNISEGTMSYFSRWMWLLLFVLLVGFPTGWFGAVLFFCRWCWCWQCGRKCCCLGDLVDMGRIMPHGWIWPLFLLWVVVICNHHHLSSQLLITFSHTIIYSLICRCRYCNEGNKETLVLVYWVMDSVDRCQIAFTSQHLVKHMYRFDGTLAQVMEVYSVDDDSNQKRQKVHKNFGFVKAV